MEDLGSMWSYQESIEEVRQSLLYKTMELESVKSEANEKLKKCREDMNQLINLLKLAYQERDEAKDNLQKVLTKICPIAPESPILLQKANSSITESNSLSDNYSSPVESFFHDSPELSTPATAAVTMKYDPFDAVVDNLVKGKTLPQQGKLLNAVMEAGPLLNTLMVAGPLPRWRNPPKVQTFKIPPVLIKGCDGNYAMGSELKGGLSCASASMMSFGNGGGGSGSGFGSGGDWRLSQVQAGKRQRFH
ncbi:hypothetical protein LINPERHAP1_LOCUS38426 [Linum perenne]